MHWQSSSDIRQQLKAAWEKGKFAGDVEMPYKVAIKGPRSDQILSSLENIKIWKAELQQAAKFYSIEHRALKSSLYGSNTLPSHLVFASIEDLLSFIGRRDDFELLQNARRESLAHFPEALAWIDKYPIRTIELSGIWRELLSILIWMKANPNPDIYLRQVTIPGVHTKVIERYASTIHAIFSFNKPQVSGLSFEERYGFKSDVQGIRIRILDPLHTLSGMTDIVVRAEELSRMAIGVKHVFVTENKINFLAFPEIRDSMVIFGKGYGFDLWKRLSWMHTKHLYYWGDIDTNGFAILNQFRSVFPHSKSIMMDAETMDLCADYWVEEPVQKTINLPNITESERSLYYSLHDSGKRSGKRLEQELIPFDYVLKVIESSILD